jgi:hypothetical protein
MLARDKLITKSINYRQKSFITLGPGDNLIKLFFFVTDAATIKANRASARIVSSKMTQRLLDEGHLAYRHLDKYICPNIYYAKSLNHAKTLIMPKA